ncbi:MAG: Sua5/YciO/YrdC/YwlC family protein [Bacteroidales bacterium]|nr:Sua5/YciO/YrdC/YwlC family protein [Bacteroidales bacterium]
MEQIIQQTVEALQRDATLLYPTDTIWGIGCDARNTAAVERLYTIKGRDHSKSMLILCASEQMESGKWRVKNGERPTTYILPETIWRRELKVAIADNLCAADGTLGIRIPNHPFCQEVIRRLGAPLVSTSANLSGHPSPKNYHEIEDELRRRVDFCVPPLPALLSEETRGSRIVKVNPDGTTTVIRP